MTTPAPATTPWVPMWNLQGGVNQQYLGAWVAGTYQPGQIVIDNGIEYLCVRQTTKRPTPWANSQAASYGTSLPANPVDGQEAVLVDSLTAPTYSWRFRYNANSTNPDKWEFIGGPAAFVTAANYTTANGPTGWVDGNGPSFAVPRIGVYTFAWGVSYAQLNAASGASAMMGVCATGNAPFAQWYYNGTIPSPHAMTYGNVRFAAAAIAKAQYQCNALTTGGAGFTTPWMTVLPQRCS